MHIVISEKSDYRLHWGWAKKKNKLNLVIKILLELLKTVLQTGMLI